jgi:hypothetical protein
MRVLGAGAAVIRPVFAQPPIRQLAPPIEAATLLNVVEALLPIAVIAVKQTMMISASITAYSTAVGPSSDLRKRRTIRDRFFITSPDTAAPGGH